MLKLKINCYLSWWERLSKVSFAEANQGPQKAGIMNDVMAFFSWLVGQFPSENLYFWGLNFEEGENPENPTLVSSLFRAFFKVWRVLLARIPFRQYPNAVDMIGGARPPRNLFADENALILCQSYFEGGLAHFLHSLALRAPPPPFRRTALPARCTRWI